MDKKTVLPENLNYDKPFLFKRLFIDESLPKVPIVVSSAIRWEDITGMEEYPVEYEDIVDWGQYKNQSKTFVTTGLFGAGICLIEFQEIFSYWAYYLTNVEVNNKKIPNSIRKEFIKNNKK